MERRKFIPALVASGLALGGGIVLSQKTNPEIWAKLTGSTQFEYEARRRESWLNPLPADYPPYHRAALILHEDPTPAPEIRQEQLDPDYLSILLKYLIRALSDTPQKRKQAVISNLATVGTSYVGGTDVNSAIAIMLDESGIFLTNRAVLGKLDGSPYQRGGVFLPSENRSIRITSSLYDPEINLGIIMAPTGKEPKRVEGIEFDSSPVEAGTTLQYLGIRGFGKFSEVIYTQGEALPSSFRPYPDYFKGTRTVYGMRPASGYGAPVVNAETGKIVGVSAYFTANVYIEREELEDDIFRGTPGHGAVYGKDDRNYSYKELTGSTYTPTALLNATLKRKVLNFQV